MVLKELNSLEILQIATEILKWKLPMLMTEETLNKVKSIAGSAVTQTHDYLQNISPRKVNKPNIRIDDIVQFNNYTKSKSRL